jgi:hypothetical protein
MASSSASSAIHDAHVEAAGCDRSGSGDQWRETDVVNWDGGLGAASGDTKVSLLLLLSLSLLLLVYCN